MRAVVIVIHPPGFDDGLGLDERGELVHSKHSSRSRPLHDSMKAFSTGFPGRMKSSCTLRR